MSANAQLYHLRRSTDRRKPWARIALFLVAVVMLETLK